MLNASVLKTVTPNKENAWEGGTMEKGRLFFKQITRNSRHFLIGIDLILVEQNHHLGYKNGYVDAIV